MHTILLILFATIFFIGFYAWTADYTLLDLGTASRISNPLIVFLSFIGLLKVAYMMARR